jgi:acetyl esterase/lipase
VVAIDYRLAPEAKLPAIVDDLRDAAAWIREQGPARFGIASERLAVAGHAAGGYLTLLSGHAVEPRPRALVSFYGYGDIAGD